MAVSARGRLPLLPLLPLRCAPRCRPLRTTACLLLPALRSPPSATAPPPRAHLQQRVVPVPACRGPWVWTVLPHELSGGHVIHLRLPPLPRLQASRRHLRCCRRRRRRSPALPPLPPRRLSRRLPVQLAQQREICGEEDVGAATRHQVGAVVDGGAAHLRAAAARGGGGGGVGGGGWGWVGVGGRHEERCWSQAASILWVYRVGTRLRWGATLPLPTNAPGGTLPHPPAAYPPAPSPALPHSAAAYPPAPSPPLPLSAAPSSPSWPPAAHRPPPPTPRAARQSRRRRGCGWGVPAQGRTQAGWGIIIGAQQGNP